MELHTGTHDVVHMWGMAFNMDTIYMTWVVFAIIIVVAFLLHGRSIWFHQAYKM